MLARIFYIFCRIFFKIYCPLSVAGRENLPSGSFMLCSNHCSHMDTPALMIATGQPFDKFGMIAAKDYFFDGKSKMSIFRRMMNLIPIHRKTTHITIRIDLKICDEFIKKTRGNLILYPEGTRSPSGEMMAFKNGAGLIASKLGIPIVPAYIEGTYLALRKGWGLPRPVKIKVKIGEPIMPNKNQSFSFARRNMTATLETLINQLKGETHVKKH